LRIWLSAWVRPLWAEDLHAQNSHGFDVSVLRLGFTAGVAGQCSAGGRDGVMGVGLALAPAALAIGPVDFDDPDPLGSEMTGEPGSIGTGPFDTDALDRAEVAQPAQQLLGAVGPPRR
jgi:hypothetical protein